MVKLSPSNKKKLLSSPYVEKITNKHIVFTNRFKIHAVVQSYQEVQKKRLPSEDGNQKLK